MDSGSPSIPRQEVSGARAVAHRILRVSACALRNLRLLHLGLDVGISGYRAWKRGGTPCHNRLTIVKSCIVFRRDRENLLRIESPEAVIRQRRLCFLADTDHQITPKNFYT